MESDGRLARTQRTRTAILDALLDLLRDGDMNPSAQEIADRAGISKRSIFVHFANLEELFQALAERGTAMVLDRVWTIDASLPLADRVDQICAQRADIHEAVGPLRRAAALRVATSSTAADSQRIARESSRIQVARVFEAELGVLDPIARAQREAAIDSMLSGESWDLWRTWHGLDAGAARTAMATALTLLVAPRP